MSSVAAVILAAGVSSRMGTFKPLLQIDGKTMVERVVDSMLMAGANPVVVVTGYRNELVERQLSGRRVVFVHNVRYVETQMLDSLLLGLAAVPNTARRILVAPADVPLVKEETIRALLNVAGRFVRPTCGGKGGHPIVIDHTLLPSLRQYRGDGGLRGAIAASGISPVDVAVDDVGVTLDSDTRDAYDRLLKYHREETQRPQPLQLDLHICLQAETAFWDMRSAQVLELIHMTGSMKQACQCMHIPCSEGWSLLREAERQLGYPLLRQEHGETHGDGLMLTENGRRLLDSWQRMQAEIRSQSEKIFRVYFPNGHLPCGEQNHDQPS